MSRLKNIIESLSEGNNTIILVSAADLRDYSEELIKKTKEQFKITEIRQEEETLDKEDWMDANEVSNLLGVSMPTLWRWANNGYLVPQFIGTGKVKRRRFKAADVKRILKMRS